MTVRKLDNWKEWLECDRIIATAFLLEWDAKEAEEKFRKQEAGELERDEEAWGLFDGDGTMQTAFRTTTRNVMYDGSSASISEINMAGSLPEVRGKGNVRTLMREVLSVFRSRGDLFAVLYPFSYAFYRKFGFEVISESTTQKVPVEQLSGFRCVHRVRQLSDARDIETLKKLYHAFIADRNLANLRAEKDWAYHGNGEFGEPDWWTRGKQRYTYIFSDETGDHAYLRFLFEPGSQGPMTGDMRVTDLVYDSPAAFRTVLGFIYGLRAKLENVIFTTHGQEDLSVLVPESSAVERSLSVGQMGRVLDVREVLLRMEQPAGEGRYSVRVEDAFLPENTGTYTVCFRDGKALSVETGDGPADLSVQVDTFSQLAAGRCSLQQAAFRPDTCIGGNEQILSEVFRKKPVAL